VCEGETGQDHLLYAACAQPFVEVGADEAVKLAMLAGDDLAGLGWDPDPLKQMSAI
jgi:hypothetical protein